MKKIFLDTSVLVSVIYEDDDMHERSKVLFDYVRREGCRLVVSDYVFDESITSVLSRAGHQMAVLTGQLILDSNIIEIVWLDQEIKLRAWEYFKKHYDKGYSFTDCTSFVLMKEMKLTHYLAFDKHFEQAGYRLYH